MERGDEPHSPAEAASLLQWWSDAGVDCLIDEHPRDWLRPPPVAEPAPAPKHSVSESPALPDQLDLFQAFLATSDALPFAAPAAPRLCPAGDPASQLMMLIDMPAAEDCDAGVLLAGEAGRLFDRMLAAIGRDRNSIYLASLSCLRAPNGSFTSDSAKQCAALARHHIGLAAPRLVLLLGDACAKALLGTPLMQARGRTHEISTHSGAIKALASFHPGFLLDQPAAKKHAWADLQMVMETLA